MTELIQQFKKIKINGSENLKVINISNNENNAKLYTSDFSIYLDSDNCFYKIVFKEIDNSLCLKIEKIYR